MKTLLIACLALLIAACGPIYNTEYRYAPPDTGEGRVCVASCETVRKQCRINADLRAENSQLRCERDASADYERCLGNARGESGQSSCTRRSCSRSADTSECKSEYDLCFQGCGGVISSQQVCSFNCP